MLTVSTCYAINFNVLVFHLDQDTCPTGEPIPLPGPDGFIASHISPDTGAGPITCTWKVEAAPGQHINVTIFNFRVHYGSVGNRNLGYARLAIKQDLRNKVLHN